MDGALSSPGYLVSSLLGTTKYSEEHPAQSPLTWVKGSKVFTRAAPPAVGRELLLHEH